MDSAVWGMIGTLAGAVVGSAASIFATWRASAVSYRMHDDKQKQERIERAKEFQRVTLLDLQESLHDLARMVSKAHEEQDLAFKSSGEWKSDVLSAEVKELKRMAFRKVTILVERVENAQLRSDVKDFKSYVSPQMSIQNQAEAQKLQHEMMEIFRPLIEKTGTVLRSYY
ncbi:hypothetical protein [Comamonas sp. MYb396]|uniref:hypothetical protein n=1 Tax=Comamonas sp. MYb396 TaxID=2745302 RepID=UPI0030B78E57